MAEPLSQETVEAQRVVERVLAGFNAPKLAPELARDTTIAMLRQGYSSVEDLNDKLVKDVVRMKKQISDLHGELDQEKSKNMNLSVADRSRKEYQQNLMQLLPDDAKGAFDRLMQVPSNSGKSTRASRRWAKIESMTVGEFFDYKAREMETMSNVITEKAGLMLNQKKMIQDLEKEVAQCEERLNLQREQNMSSKTSRAMDTTLGVDDLGKRKAQLEEEIESLEEHEERLKQRKGELEGDIQLLEGSQAPAHNETKALPSATILDLGHADGAPTPLLEQEVLTETENAKRNMAYTISVLAGFADALARAYIGAFMKRLRRQPPDDLRKGGEEWTNLAKKAWCSIYLPIYLLDSMSGATEMESGTNDEGRSDEQAGKEGRLSRSQWLLRTVVSHLTSNDRGIKVENVAQEYFPDKTPLKDILTGLSAEIGQKDAKELWKWCEEEHPGGEFNQGLLSELDSNCFPM